MKIPLIKPFITDEIKARVCEVLDSGYLTEGPVTRQFEDSIKDYKIAIELRPNDHTTHSNLALSFLKIGDQQNAISSFKTAARLGNVPIQKHLTSKGIKW